MHPLCRPRPASVHAGTGLAPYNSPMPHKPDNPQHEHDHGVVVAPARPDTARPPLYSVFLLNDDYTPMDFVVNVLRKIFHKNAEEATRIMLHVHQNGVGECGVFTYEVAETKVTLVMDYARKHQHPLQCIMEKN